MQNKNLIIICGPTGIGKTELAVKLALKYDGEIISADSMQVYKYMDIATAKPDEEILRKVKHYLISIIEPSESFSAYKFKELASYAIEEIYNKNKLPFIVGGTGLYINALVYGLSDAPPADLKLREKLKNLAKEKGLLFLYEKLKKLDPEYAEKISKNDPVRIIRALEVYEKTKIKFSEFCKKHNKTPNYNCLWIGLNQNRKELYEKINKRTEDMFKKGLIDETKKLLAMGINEELLRNKVIGYSDVIDYLNGKITLQQAIENVKRKTRNYAKRQLTWFKKEKNINWFSPHQINEIESIINNWLKINKN